MSHLVWISTGFLYVGSALAFAPGDQVPDATVTAHGWDALDYVEQVSVTDDLVPGDTITGPFVTEAELTALRAIVGGIAGIDADGDVIDSSARKLERRDSRVWNVLEHGVPSNGTSSVTTSVHALRDLAGANAHLFFPNGTYSVTGGLDMTAAGQWWELAPGAIIKWTAGATTGSLVKLTGAKSKVTGGTLDGNKANITGGNCFNIVGANSRIQGVTVQNPYGYGCYSLDAAGWKVLDCTFTGSRGATVYAEGNVKNAVVEGNTFDVSGATGLVIGFHSTTAGKSCDGVRVRNNVITTGSTDVCIEIGQFAGDRPKDCDVTGNRITSGSSKAISYDKVDGGIVTNNECRNGSYAGAAGVIEIVACDGTKVVNNQVWCVGTATATVGIGLDKASQILVNGNEVYDASDAPIKQITTNTVSTPECRRNRVINNYLRAAGTPTAGVWLQNSQATGVMTDTLITGNTILGPGTGQAVKVAGSNGGVISGVFIAANRIDAWATGVSSTGTAVTDTRARYNHITATTTAYSGVALRGSATWNPASIATGASTTTTVTATGAALGDVATCAFSLTLAAGMVMVATVTAADTVTVTLLNLSGGTVDVASGTVTVVVEKT